MRYVWSVFLLVVALLIGRTVWLRLHPTLPLATKTTPAPLLPSRSTAYVVRSTAAGIAAPISVEKAPAAPAPAAPAKLRRLPALRPIAPVAKADSIVAFALRQLGTNYCYAGITPEGGFDCSGFVLYVYARYGVATPHSTALLIDVGRPVARTEARPGDIVVFTGTAATSTTPGHAGIVISRPGEPIRFVHASSARRESGVKISQVEGTGYERRFMQVRRVL